MCLMGKIADWIHRIDKQDLDRVVDDIRPAESINLKFQYYSATTGQQTITVPPDEDWIIHGITIMNTLRDSRAQTFWTREQTDSTDRTFKSEVTASSGTGRPADACVGLELPLRVPQGTRIRCEDLAFQAGDTVVAFFARYEVKRT